MRSEVNELARAEPPPFHAAAPEGSRLAALRSSQLLDTAPEDAFDRLTHLARKLMRTPISLISLVDQGRQFFKSQQGLSEPWASRRQTPLSHSFCQHVVASGEALVVRDARAAPLVKENLAIQDLNVIAYLGVPLRDPHGHVLGSLCVIDAEPRDWSPGDVAALGDLAATAMSEIALRQALRQQLTMEAELRASERRNKLLLRELNHRVNNALAIVHSVVRQSLRSASTLLQAGAAIEGRLTALGRAHSLLSQDTQAAWGMRDLVTTTTAGFRRGEGSFSLDGDNVALPASLVLMFSLALHELATNASKYGALSVPSGSVRVCWRVDRLEGRRRLVLQWAEQGGPPVQRPRRSGFGSQLIRRTAEAENAAVSLDFAETGLRCTIAVPLVEAGDDDAAAAG